MDILTSLTIVFLTYKLLMPFVAWIVPVDRMNSAAKYIEKTERRLPTKVLLQFFRRIQKKKLK